MSAAKPPSYESAPISVSGNPHERTVEWYRPDRLWQICRIFLSGALLVSVGGIICGVAFAHTRQPDTLTWAHGVLLLGGIGVLSGPLSTVVRLLKLLREELYIALCSDGLAFCDDNRIQFYPWERLMSASYHQETQALSLHLREGESLHIHGPFKELTTPEIARRINTIRTKALWNTLDTSEY